MNKTEARPTSQPALDDPRVVAALEEYMAAAEAGRRPDRSAFFARHPSVADVLIPCLDGMEMLCGLDQSGDGSAPPLLATPLGDFRLIREIGRGGMGIVYEAEQMSLGRRVALKVLPFAATMDPRHLHRFQNEARAAASLEHPHIVPVYAVGCERGVHYYAMKFIEGQSLAQVIADLRVARPERSEGRADLPVPSTPFEDSGRATQPPPNGRGSENTSPVAALTTQRAPRDAAAFRQIAEWGIQAAEALEHAHSVGIVHRDIKPANLMIDSRSVLWVADFGLARTAADAGLTMTGDVIGTLRYMSPEQAMAKHGLVDHRTDIYSLGVTLYELLTGTPAVGGEDREEILNRITLDEPRSPRALDAGIPRDLETVVLKALAKEPADRYATAQELADDFRRFLEDRPIRARRPSWLKSLRKWFQRHPAVVRSAVLMVFLTAVAFGIGTWLLWREQEKTRQALDLANRNATQVRDLVSELVVRLGGKDMAGFPIVQEVRADFAAKALKLLETYVDQEGAYKETLPISGDTCLIIGNIYRSLGQRDRAQHAYRKAIAIHERCDAKYPDQFHDHVGQAHMHLGLELWDVERTEEAEAEFVKSRAAFAHAFHSDPRDVHALMHMTWFHSICPLTALRDPDLALEAAQELVRLQPESGGNHVVLGVAQYRIGNWPSAIEALDEGARRRNGGKAVELFFEAMAYQKLGEQKKATAFYLRAVEWLEKHRVGDVEGHLFRAEAARVLGIENNKGR